MSLLLLACTLPHIDLPGQDTWPLGEDSQDSDPIEEVTFEATLEGTVSVVLTRTGDDGTPEIVAWPDSTCGDEYSFGWIFLTAYEEDDSGDGRKYLGEKVIKNPTTGENPFSFDIRKAGEGPVTVFAVVDYWGDRVIGTDDYTSSHAGEVDVVTDGVHTNVDITVFVPECYTPGGCGSTSSVSGDITITNSYAGGEAVAMLVDMAGNGPYNEAWTNPTPTGGGAEAPYSVVTCVDWGELRLIGAWDSNGNDMADPLDRWGAYAPEPDEDGNPIHIGSAALTDMTIQIPLGDEGGIAVVPFVTWTGALSIHNGSFSDLPEGSSVYVTAMKQRPDLDVAVEAFATDSYDTQSFDWSELQGQTSLDYKLRVPANSIAYLWAYADEDGNGVVNEPGEHVARGGEHSSGKLPTGSSSTTDLDIQLGTPD